jgi:hypothetical protein
MRTKNLPKSRLINTLQHLLTSTFDQRAIVLITRRISSHEEEVGRALSHGAASSYAEPKVSTSSLFPALELHLLHIQTMMTTVIRTTLGTQLDDLLRNTLQHFRTSTMTNERLY